MTDQPDARPVRSRPFHGWIVVFGAFLVTLVAFGSAYSFTSFVEALEAEFGANRATVSTAFSAAVFIFFGFGFISGALADRFGPRMVVPVGVVILSGGMIAASFATDIWQFLALSGGGIGFGVGFAYVPATAAVQPWFNRRRGLASGLAVSGIGIGTLIGPPIAIFLIEAVGWRETYRVFAMVVLVVGLPASLLLDHRPDRHGGPEPAGPAMAGQGDGPQLTFAEASTTPAYWMYYFVTALIAAGIFVPFVHIEPDMAARGHAAGSGAALLSVIGLGSAGGRFVIGGIADRFGRVRSMAVTFVGMGVAYLIWLAADDFRVLVGFAALFGLSYGSYVALQPALIADYFGSRALGVMIGSTYSAVSLGVIFGPTLAGYAFDVTGSYAAPIIGAAATTFAALALLLLMPSPAENAARLSR